MGDAGVADFEVVLIQVADEGAGGVLDGDEQADEADVGAEDGGLCEAGDEANSKQA